MRFLPSTNADVPSQILDGQSAQAPITFTGRAGVHDVCQRQLSIAWQATLRSHPVRCDADKSAYVDYMFMNIHRTSYLFKVCSIC